MSLYVIVDFLGIAKQQWDFLVKEDMLHYDKDSNGCSSLLFLLGLTFQAHIMVLIARHTKIIRALILFSSLKQWQWSEKVLYCIYPYTSCPVILKECGNQFSWSS